MLKSTLGKPLKLAQITCKTNLKTCHSNLKAIASMILPCIIINNENIQAPQPVYNFVWGWQHLDSLPPIMNNYEVFISCNKINSCRPPQSKSVPGIQLGEQMCLPLQIIKICVVLLKCACRMAFFNMCLADNLKDATDCGGLNTCTLFLTHKNLFNAHSYMPKSFFDGPI